MIFKLIKMTRGVTASVMLTDDLNFQFVQWLSKIFKSLGFILINLVIVNVMKSEK